MGQCYAAAEAGEAGKGDGGETDGCFLHIARSWTRRLVGPAFREDRELRVSDVRYPLEPIYISETVKKAMNPTFRHIDLSACSPGVTRVDRVIVRVWVKKAMAESQWKLLLELETALHRLQYLGKGVR